MTHKSLKQLQKGLYFFSIILWLIPLPLKVKFLAVVQVKDFIFLPNLHQIRLAGHVGFFFNFY
jgi:hypothetical protein